MSTADDDFGFALPAFQPDSALQAVQRAARDLKLSARGAGFDLRGKPVLQAAVEGDTLQVRLARKLAMTPEWDRHTVSNAAEQRKLIDELKKRLARWDQED